MSGWVIEPRGGSWSEGSRDRVTRVRTTGHRRPRPTRPERERGVCGGVRGMVRPQGACKAGESATHPGTAAYGQPHGAAPPFAARAALVHAPAHTRAGGCTACPVPLRTPQRVCGVGASRTAASTGRRHQHQHGTTRALTALGEEAAEVNVVGLALWEVCHRLRSLAHTLSGTQAATRTGKRAHGPGRLVTSNFVPRSTTDRVPLVTGGAALLHWCSGA